MYNLIRNLLRYKHLTFSSGFKSVKIFAIFSYTFKVQCGRSRCHRNKSLREICKKNKNYPFEYTPQYLDHLRWNPYYSFIHTRLGLDSLHLTNILDFKYGLFVQQPLSLSILSIFFLKTESMNNFLMFWWRYTFLGLTNKNLKKCVKFLYSEAIMSDNSDKMMR